MKAARSVLSYEPLSRKAVALVSILTLLIGTFSAGAVAQRKRDVKSASALSEEQRALHVLNRLGFGARPGDIERVQAMGMDRYINLQLHPAQIVDSEAEARVKNLATLNMTTAELYEKYPQPGQLIRQLQRRGELPADVDPQKLQQQAQAQNQAQNNAANAQRNAVNGETSTPAMPADTVAANEQSKKAAEYREKLRDYYQKNGLQQPARITTELQASRILRAVYSERQLQEVMVDFWTNHFNVFAGKGADRWLLTSYDRDTIRPHTLGKFYDLLVADAQSPAMLFYLDNVQSVSPNAQLPQQRPGTARGPLAGLRILNNVQPPRPPQQPQQRRGI